MHRKSRIGKRMDLEYKAHFLGMHCYCKGGTVNISHQWGLIFSHMQWSLILIRLMWLDQKNPYMNENIGGNPFRGLDEFETKPS